MPFYKAHMYMVVGLPLNTHWAAGQSNLTPAAGSA